MSRLIFQKDYIIVIPQYQNVKMHSHMMQHFFLDAQGHTIELENETITGNVVILESGVKHASKLSPNHGLILLVDSTSVLAKTAREKYLNGKGWAVCSSKLKVKSDIRDDDEEEIVKCVENILYSTGLRAISKNVMDERIVELLEFIRDSKTADLSLDTLAARTSLSKSRLTHLFRQQTGVGLKNFLLLGKLKNAYQSVVQGQSITEAAMNNGFSDSAHLSATCMKLTGIPMHLVMKDS